MTSSNLCPRCGATWTVEAGAAAAVESCPHCTSTAAAAEDDGTVDAVATPGAGRGLVGSVLYGLSLPERVLRGAVGLTAGAARELADVLVPQAFHDSATYRIAVENALGFLTGTIGGVPRPETGMDEPDASGVMARRAVGNFVDLAGVAFLHVSPMWLLAVVSDVAYGTQTYTRELARELQAQGVIDDASTIHHVDDVLAALRQTCGAAAESLDQPPLSLEDLRRTIDETRASLSRADVSKLVPEAELRRYWEEMQEVARREEVSLLGVSGAIAMQTLGRLKAAGVSTLVGVNVAGGLVGRTVLGHYRDSLTRIQQQGFYESVRASYGPYVTAVFDNFSPRKSSWTEQCLDPSLPGRLVSRWLGGRAASETTASGGAGDSERESAPPR